LLEIRQQMDDGDGALFSSVLNITAYAECLSTKSYELGGIHSCQKMVSS